MPSPRSWAALSLLAALVSTAGSDLFAGDAIVQKFGDWTVTIQPGLRGSGARDATGESGIQFVPQATPSEDEGGPVVVPGDAGEPAGNPLAMVQLYSQVYNQIPFSRAEYAANPSYRHDATMEFLFGKMRPTVIHRGTAARRPAPAAQPSFPAMYSPYGFNSYYYPFYYGTSGYGWLQPASLW